MAATIERRLFMAASARIFNRGSILPSILELESQIRAQNESAREKADEIVEKAEREAERIIDEARSSIRDIEKEERSLLEKQMENNLEEIETSGDRQLADLKSAIERNGDAAVDFIVGNILPGANSGSDLTE